MATTVHPLIGAPSARQGKVALREYREGDWSGYHPITGPAGELAFEGLEPYEGKLSRTVLRGALGW